MKDTYHKFEKILFDERASIIDSLGELGRINPDDTSDWEPVAAELNTDSAEIEERAQGITNFEERSALEYKLEERLHHIDEALARITEGTYGYCTICKKEIEHERLEIIPEATTCKAHLNHPLI